MLCPPIKNTQMWFFLIFWHCSPLPSSLPCAVMHIQLAQLINTKILEYNFEVMLIQQKFCD